MHAVSLALAATLLTMSTETLAQSYLGLSAEGEQVREKIWGPEVKRLLNLWNEATRIREQIGKELDRPNPSWERLRPLISAYEAKRAEARTISLGLNARMVDQLPDDDRIKYLRKEYGTPKPPMVIVPPPQ